MIQEAAYLETMRSCASFNSSTQRERTARLPFLDPQTGIAQRPGHLLRSAEERGPGRYPDQVYSYPWRRYRRRPGSLRGRMEQELFGAPPLARDAGEGQAEGGAGDSRDGVFAYPQREAARSQTYAVESAYLDDEDDEVEDADDASDGDDYAETTKKGKGGGKTPKDKPSKKAPAGAPYTVGKDGKKRYFGGAAAALIPPEEKPYICPRKNCDARYKSKPGLNYHLAHVHSDFNGIGKGPGSGVETSHPTPNTTITHSAPLPAPKAAGGTGGTEDSAPEGAHPPNDYCDFCLGKGPDNRKSGTAEELTSCHDCGRSGHPTCLKFTPNMIVSTKKYGWQCIECKSCAICGTSENDESLLFCDDCDRGFHLYCLTPKLEAPPAGEWSCHLCQVHFGSQASHPLQPRPADAAAAAAPATLPPPPGPLPTLPPQPPPPTLPPPPPPTLPPRPSS